MAIFFKFHTPKPKQFHYRPLYYDERKERLEKMKAQAEAEAKAGKSGRYIGLQKGFLSEHKAQSKGGKVILQQSSLIRLILIFVLVMITVYVISKVDPELFQLLIK